MVKEVVKPGAPSAYIPPPSGPYPPSGGGGYYPPGPGGGGSIGGGFPDPANLFGRSQQTNARLVFDLEFSCAAEKRHKSLPEQFSSIIS